jgi:hypothetical protein
MAIIIASSTSKNEHAHFYCDGINDQVEINAAIQSFDGRGGRIVLLEGIFHIGASINFALAGTPDDNITIEGQGDSTVLKVADGCTVALCIINCGAESGGLTPTLKNIKFKNFRIDNNSANNTGASHIGICLWAVNNAVIENITIETSPPNPPYSTGGYACLIINSSDILITNCNFNEWEINGLEVRTTSRIIISDCHLNDSRFEIYSNCTDFKIVDNIFKNTECYWGTDNLPDVIDGFEIIGNTFRDCKATVACSKNIMISDNIFLGTGSGISLEANVSDILISANYFRSTMQLRLNGENGFVSGNKFYAVANWNSCIYSLEAGAPNKWIIQNNSFDMVNSADMTFGINLASGTDVFIYNNFFRDLYAGINIKATVTSVNNLGNVFTNLDNNVIDLREV